MVFGDACHRLVFDEACGVIGVSAGAVVDRVFDTPPSVCSD